MSGERQYTHWHSEKYVCKECSGSLIVTNLNPEFSWYCYNLECKNTGKFFKTPTEKVPKELGKLKKE